MPCNNECESLCVCVWKAQAHHHFIPFALSHSLDALATLWFLVCPHSPLNGLHSLAPEASEPILPPSHYNESFFNQMSVCGWVCLLVIGKWRNAPYTFGLMVPWGGERERIVVPWSWGRERERVGQRPLSICLRYGECHDDTDRWSQSVTDTPYLGYGVWCQLFSSQNLTGVLGSLKKAHIKGAECVWVRERSGSCEKWMAP